VTTRILYLATSAEIGGAERSILELLRGLPKEKFSPYLIVPKDGPLARAGRKLDVQVKIESWPELVLRTGRERGLVNRLRTLLIPFLLLPTVLRLRRYVKANSIRIVHTNGIKAHLIGCGATAITGVPLVWHLRDVLSPGLIRSVLRLLGLVGPRQIIANSMASARSLRLPVADRKVRVIYNGIDLREFRAIPGTEGLRASLRIPKDSFVVGSVGALSPLKGHLHLIRAMVPVLREAPHARLLIVGDEIYDTLGHSGYRRVLEDEVDRMGLTSRVIFAGWRDDIVPLYSIMDVVVLGSVRPESFGRVLIEAMACGRPVIATDLGGPREILSRPEYGILVLPEDADALASAILTLHRDAAMRLEMAHLGRARVAELFCIDRHVKEVCAIYSSLLRESCLNNDQRPAEAAP